MQLAGWSKERSANHLRTPPDASGNTPDFADTIIAKGGWHLSWSQRLVGGTYPGHLHTPVASGDTPDFADTPLQKVGWHLSHQFDWQELKFVC